MIKKRTATVLALATAIAIPAEGLRQYAYYDPVGILTICYGDTNNVKPGQYATVQECKARLDEEMIDAIETVDRCVPNLPDNVLAAFSDAAYNIGPRIACDTNRSTAARLLKAGRYEEACRQLPRWDRAGGVVLPGLTKRRAKEMELCLS
jgi:GH24 family phage-related lysozyme (muramidase)